MILIKEFVKTWALFLLNVGWQLEQKRLTRPQTVFSRLLTVPLRSDKHKSRSTVRSGSINTDDNLVLDEERQAILWGKGDI